MWGDLPHFCAPYFLFNRNAKKTEPFDPGTLLKSSAPIEKYGIQMSGNYILLAREYDHDDVLIMDKQTLKPIGKYRDAIHAVILP